MTVADDTVLHMAINDSAEMHVWSQTSPYSELEVLQLSRDTTPVEIFD